MLMAKTDWEARLKKGMRSAQDLAFSQLWGAEEEKVEFDWGGAKPRAPIPVPDDLPEEVQRLINDHPHIDPNAIINMYRQRAGEDNG